MSLHSPSIFNLLLCDKEKEIEDDNLDRFILVKGDCGMSEPIIQSMWSTILTYSTRYYVLIILLVLAYFVIVLRKQIDYLIMKDDRVWRRWYKAIFLCPSCHRRLRPADHPPNYICPKCGDAFAFGDKAAKDWIKNRPAMTKGEFVRYFTLLFLLAVGAVWIFTSGVLKQ